MKRLGILTFHWANNYGAVLQAFALLTYINNNFDYNAEIIDFALSDHLERNRISHLFSSTKNPKILWRVFISLIKHYGDIRVRQHKFDVFRNEYLKLSDRISSEREFIQSPPKYDVYITGSDQVFNPKFSPKLAYFLNFRKKKCIKVSYAASFGFSEFPLSFTQLIDKAVIDFDCLSCREASGSEYLSNIVGYDVPTVVDPTFLLSKEDWQPIIKFPQNKGKYVFVYDLNGGISNIQLAQIVAKYSGLEIICATNNVRTDEYEGCLTLYNVGPQDFLGYIQNADYVITDSFHGTALSLIFHRKVLVYIANKKVSGRITSLLEQLNLSDQIVWSIDDFCLERVDFKKYDDSLLSMISRSEEYLKKALTFE